MKIDTSKFRVSKVNSKFSLAREISDYYGKDLTNMMLGFISRKGEQSVRDELIQAQKNGTPIALFIWKLGQIKIIDLTNKIKGV